MNIFSIKFQPKKLSNRENNPLFQTLPSSSVFSAKHLLSFLLLIICLTTLSLPLSASSDCTQRYIEAGAVPQGPNASWRVIMSQCSLPAATSGNGLGNTCGNRKDQITRFCNTACPSTASKEDITACFFPPSKPAPNVEKEKGRSCDAEGNPCSPTSGNKYQIEHDYRSVHGDLNITRHYNSLTPSNKGQGMGWTSRLSPYISFNASDASLRDQLVVHQANGRSEIWKKVNELWQGDPDSRLALLENAQGFQLTLPGAHVEHYDSQGKLLTRHRQGLITRYTYNDENKLTDVVDPFGRSLHLSYNAEGLPEQITTPDGDLQYAYDDQANLISVIYPDGSHKTYLYENANLPHHLTGIIDENGHHFASWTYDDKGRVITSEHAEGVEKVTLQYQADSTTVQGVLGDSRTYHLALQHGVRNVSAISGDPCTTCANGQMQRRSYDDNGFLSGYTDWNGHQTLLVNNARGLVTSHTEAVGTAQERLTTIQWHDELDLPIRIDAQGRQIRFVYSQTGQLLSQTVEDMDSGETRTITYRYHPEGENGAGLIASVDGSRDKVDDSIHYDYDAQSNLITITNALGHITSITSHDASGRPTTVMDAKGVKTVLSYDLRGRLTQHARASSTTTYQYDATGHLTRLTLADGSYLDYQYDAAQRLIRLSDNENNQIRYALDAMGNRTTTEVSDPTGRMTHTQNSVFDQLSRLQQHLGAEGQQQTLSYDANHNLRDRHDALNRKTEHRYDALDRLIQTLNPKQHSTDYQYDLRDNLTQVTDAKGLSTRHTYNNFDEFVQQISPDTGLTTFRYNKAGSLIERTDARGVTVGFNYDALNRLTGIDYAEDRLDVVHFYDEGEYGKGLLTSTQDASGDTSYTYDAHGNVLSHTRDVGGIRYTTNYHYNAANRQVGMTYPNGDSLTYVRNDNGELSSIIATINGVAHTLLSDADYLPFGSVKQFTYGNGLSYNANFDQSYRLKQQNIADVQNQQYRYSEVNNLLALNDPLNNENDQQFEYDALDRLNLAQGQYGTFDYDYDALGNRLNKNTDNQYNRYDYDTQSHQLQHITTTDATQSYQYDAVGNTIDNGRYQFSYGEDNRLHQVLQADKVLARYDYNALGQRSRKYVNGEASLALAQLITQEQALRTQHQLLVQQLEDSNSLLARVKTHRIPNPATWRDRIIDRLLKNWIEEQQVRIETQQQNLNTSQKRIDLIQVNIAEYQTLLDSGDESNRIETQIITEYVYDLQGRLIAEITAGNHKNYLYFNGQPLAIIKNNRVYYYHNDHLGTPQRMTDQNQNIVWQAEYQPFGVATVTIETITNNIRFPGQYFDQETGLHYNYFRYYDPETGRYITSDPIGLAGGLNTYLYANANPIRYTDPLGLCPWCVAYFVFEVGMSAYDAYNTADTVLDPCASGGAKALAGGAFMAGVLLPGAGYGLIDDVARSGLKQFGRSVDDLSNAASQSFKNTGLTRAARALDKHAAGQRSTGTFPPLSGNAAARNKQAQQIVDDILTSPKSEFKTLGRGGLQVRFPGGQGIRFNKDGSFSGFID